MDSDLLHLLNTHKLFSSLDKLTIEKILPKFTKVELDHDSVLFHQGSPSDSVYILVSGKLSAIVTDANNHTKTIGHIEAGETVGELGALSNEPRSLTIKALRNSVLFMLPNKDFIELCYLYPAIMFATIRPVIERSQNLIHMLTTEHTNQSIGLVPANTTAEFTRFAEKFLSHAANYSSLIIVSDFNPDFNDPNIHLAALKEKIQTIESSKKHSQKILYLLQSFNTPLAKICLKKIDLLYLVADSQAPIKIDSTILDTIHSHQTHFTTNPVLILLHPPDTVLPINTETWLQLTQFSMHHHVKINATRHYQRLLRFIRGKAVGLVLGGGGTRGWAHIGAIKALREHKIPVDMIGGSSVGAIIAGCFAIRESAADAYKRFHTIVESSRGSISWKNLTWPYVSLFNAKKFTESLQKTFSDIQIEDLWLPYFCISSNMATCTEEIHRSGLLWQKTRCSASVPGLIPPMVINGELHLDGGLLNNLPVDVMRQFLGKKGRITAVELNTALRDYRRYAFPPILTLKQTLLAKFGMSRETYKFPRFIDNFLRGLLIGSSAKTKQNGFIANFLINLNLSGFRLLNANLKQAEKMTETGYLETLARINQEKNRKL